MRPSLPRGRELIVTARNRTIQAGKHGGTGTVLLCLLGAANSARAQSVLLPPPVYSTTPPAIQAQMEEGGIVGGGQNPALPDLSNLLQWGPATLHPHAYYQLTYSSGLQSAPGQPQSSLVQTFTPGMLMTLGKHWTIDYEPTLTFYSSSQFHDTLNQSANLNWGTFYEDWSLGFSQSVNVSDSPLVQTGMQTSTQSYSTGLTGSHALNSFFALDASVSQSITSAAGFNGSKSWNTMEYLNYQYAPRLTFGIGAGIGYSLVSMGPNMLDETVQGRVAWSVANKTSLLIHAGVQDVQYLNGDVPNTLTPVYGLGITYQATAFTTVSLNGDRTVTPSFFASQATETTTLGLSVDQRILKYFNLSLGGSYSAMDYISASANVPAGRADTYYSLSSRLSWHFLKRATAALTYQYSENISNTTGFSFASEQGGLELGYSF
jgi:hypothetical protein